MIVKTTKLSKFSVCLSIQSLGKPAGAPGIDASSGNVYLHYVNGSACGKGTKTYSAKVYFKCMKGADQVRSHGRVIIILFNNNTIFK